MLVLSKSNAEIAKKGKLRVNVGRRMRRRWMRRRPILISRAVPPQAAGSQKLKLLFGTPSFINYKTQTKQNTKFKKADKTKCIPILIKIKLR